MIRLASHIAALSLAAALAGCDLTDVEIVDFTDVFVAEVFVTVGGAPNDNRLRALIHGTEPGGEPSSATYPDADVAVADGDGATALLSLASLAECVADRPDGASGSCYAADAIVAGSYEAGERLSLEVTLADGRTVSGSTTIPGAFSVDGVTETCRVDPDTRLPLRWSSSDAALAYLSEAAITGLSDALADEGISAPDTVYLLGLSISEADTTVSFPNEFGVFDRFDLDRDLSVRLQRGLPEGVRAQVAITAVDRNYVNWVRGGNFNPSGSVRVSSLVGDGVGVFGSAVTRQFTIVSSANTAVAPACGEA